MKDIGETAGLWISYAPADTVFDSTVDEMVNAYETVADRQAGTACHVANAAVFLAFDDAVYISGVALTSDGGPQITAGG